MDVVIEICVKYPGGPTRIKGTDIHTWRALLLYIYIYIFIYLYIFIYIYIYNIIGAVLY
jgi:hypothetical protein